ncbi:MAG: lipopolysaccharide heptosyltransferase I [Rhodocyclaceae bacterium]|nr:MAG: lipopolysaccharide heptosyltransferase I [Rhodocyclaceae bacterium]
MRILLVKTSSLGDVIHNLPVASDIHRHLPEARIDWVVEENFAPLPRLHPAIERVIPVAVRRWRKSLLSHGTWAEIAAFKADLRSVPYDLVLDTQGLLKSALISHQAALSATGRRCGHDRTSAREPWAARFYDQGYAIAKDMHAVERNRHLAAAALHYPLDSPLDYGLRAQPLNADWLPRLPHAVLLTATSRDDKLWPEDRWIALGHALHEQGLTAIFPAGNPTERARAARIAQRIPEAVAAPALDLATLAQLLAGAVKVVGVDTGLTHLAAALARPTVAIFTGSDPLLTGVHAGPRAINLGGIGHAPALADVLQALTATGTSEAGAIAP